MNVPNKETVKELEETKAMKGNKKKYKRYDSFGETLKEAK